MRSPLCLRVFVFNYKIREIRFIRVRYEGWESSVIMHIRGTIIHIIHIRFSWKEMGCVVFERNENNVNNLIQQ